MAEDEQSLDKENGGITQCVFKSVVLVKSQLLGIGRYGAVCKAKCDDLHCAAKILHPALFHHGPFVPATSVKTTSGVRQFQQECEFLRAISHPNIVQYLGVFYDKESGSHVWLFELMERNLTSLLDQAKEMMPYYLQVNLCYDAALALAFLHSIGVVHCNLSSNNVLVIGNGCRAKVCDFQMTKFGSTSFNALPRSSSDNVYMPPEAARLPPVFSKRGDCFSFGVLGIQIVTRQFPNPKERFVTIDYPQSPTGTIEIPVLEIKRRESHIGMIDLDHPLRNVLLECLKDKEQERPTASEVCSQLAAQRDTSEYKYSLEQSSDSFKAIETQVRSPEDGLSQLAQLQEDMESKDDILRSQVKELKTREEEMKAMKVQHTAELQARNLEFDESEKEVKRLRIDSENSLSEISILRNSLLEAKNDIKVQDGQIQELKLELQNVGRSNANKDHTYELLDAAPGDSRTLIRKAVKNQHMLQWEMCQHAPTKITQGAVTVKEDLAYFASTTEVIFHDKITKLIAKYSIHKRVFEYSSKDETWSTLPEHPYRGYALVIVQGFLTAIGGKEINGHHTVTNKLFSLCRAGVHRTDRKWNEIVKPMPTRRFEAAAASNEQVLVVAGGLSNSYKRLDSVDVLTIETQQWATASSLPFPVYSAVAVIHEDRFYITGGFSQRGANRSVVSSSIEDLLESQTKVWIKIASVPLSRSTCASIQGELLAIGGIDSTQQTSSAVYRYDEDADCWEVIGHMLTPRYNPLVTVLPDNKLIVVGGHKSPFEGECDVVEVGTPACN